MADTNLMQPAPGVAETAEKPFGPVAAAFLAAGTGGVALGILTTLAEANDKVKSWLEFNSRVGPLSGKTLLALVAFFASWVVLHLTLRDRDVQPKAVFTWTAVLFGIAVILTFPTFFQAFAPKE